MGLRWFGVVWLWGLRECLGFVWEAWVFLWFVLLGYVV